MFTGIIEEVGIVKTITKNFVTVFCNKILNDLSVGDSISVDGVCLTAISFDEKSFSANVSEETFAVTKLGELSPGSYVNLERAMLVGSRFGGHIVTGHVDCVSKIIKLNKKEGFYELIIELPIEYSKHIVRKGSITVDGISLTVAEINNNEFKIAIIPHTFENTNLSKLKIASKVNLEFDILAKYVEKNILMADNKSNITEDFLRDNGFM